MRPQQYLHEPSGLDRSPSLRLECARRRPHGTKALGKVMAAGNAAGPAGDRIWNLDIPDVIQLVYQHIDVGDEPYTFRGRG